MSYFYIPYCDLWIWSKLSGFIDIINLNDIWQITASRLLFSKQTIPHYYLTVDTCVDKLMDWVQKWSIYQNKSCHLIICDKFNFFLLSRLRAQLNLLQESSSGKWISVNDFVIKVNFWYGLDKDAKYFSLFAATRKLCLHFGLGPNEMGQVKYAYVKWWITCATSSKTSYDLHVLERSWMLVFALSSYMLLWRLLWNAC